MHSFLNEMNVVLGQLYILGILIRDEENYLEEEIQCTKTFLVECRTREDPSWYVRQINPFKQKILGGVAAHLQDDRTGSNEEFELTLETLDSALGKLMVRACQVVHLAQPAAEFPDLFLADYLKRVVGGDPSGKNCFFHYYSVWTKKAIDWKGEANFLQSHRPLANIFSFLFNAGPDQAGSLEIEYLRSGSEEIFCWRGLNLPEVFHRFLAGNFPLPPEDGLAGFYLGVQDLQAAGFSLHWESALDGLKLSLQPEARKHE